MSGLSVQASVLAIVLALGFCALVFELIRRHRLQERFSVVWAIVAVAMLAGAVTPGSLQAIGRLTGISDTSIALLSLLMLFVLGVLLYLTVIASTQAGRVTRLGQEVAILRAEVEDLRLRRCEDRSHRPPGSACGQRDD